MMLTVLQPVQRLHHARRITWEVYWKLIDLQPSRKSLPTVDRGLDVNSPARCSQTLYKEPKPDRKKGRVSTLKHFTP